MSSHPPSPHFLLKPQLQLPKHDVAEGPRNLRVERENDGTQSHTKIEIGEQVAHDEHTIAGASGPLRNSGERWEDREMRIGAVFVPVKTPYVYELAFV